MRHGMSQRRFNRTSEHRKAMFKNLTVSLLMHEQIKTTLPKAKDLRSVVEKIITLGRTDSVANRRIAMSFLQDAEIVKKLFTVIGPRYAKRPGGYTRVLKAGFRYGDMAPMAIIELVDRDVSAKGSNIKKIEEKSAEAKKETKKSEVKKVKIEKDSKSVKPVNTKTAAKAPRRRVAASSGK